MKTPSFHCSRVISTLWIWALCWCETGWCAAPPPQRNLGPLVTARWESATCIAVIAHDPARVERLELIGDYRVLQHGRPLVISAISHETRLIDLIPEGWPEKPVKQHIAYLHLAHPADESNEVMVAWRAAPGRLRLAPLRASAVQCLQVNSLGYQPDDPAKVGIIGAWTGTLGPLATGAATTQFAVLDAATGSNVFSGTPQLLATNDAESGANVYRLDFSPLSATGWYRVHLPGIGYSIPFAINADVYAPALRALLRALYHQRCGIAIGPPYTQYGHGVCHRSPALLVDVADSMDKVMQTLPEHVIKPKKTIDGWGGWHDAGDYDRAGWHIFVVMYLLDAYAMCPSNFHDGDLNIPESGNGIPDILDEARWGLAWFKRMQDKADGGLFYRIDTKDYGSSVPEQDRQQLYAMKKYPKYTGYFAAGAAQAARVLQPFIASNEYADLIARAAQAYRYAQRHDAPVEALGHAAAELYLTTGGEAYQRDFLKTRYTHSWSYAASAATNLNRAAQQACRYYFITAAGETMAAYGKHAYPCGKNGIGSGAGHDAATLMRAYALTGDAAYLAAARMAVNAQLGLNALRRCWITGLGIDPPEEITHAPSTALGRSPVPGIPIFGPKRCDEKTEATHARLLWEVCEPKPYPWMRQWAPVWEIPSMCEFSVRDIAEIVVGYTGLQGK